VEVKAVPVRAETRCVAIRHGGLAPWDQLLRGCRHKRVVVAVVHLVQRQHDGLHPMCT